MKKLTIAGVFFSILACAGIARAADFYVSTSGSAAGDGSIGDPWDLDTALHHPPAVQPGDTIWVRGGTYEGAHTSRLAGTEGSPITVRGYRRERAILDYADNTNCNPAETDECSPNNKRCNALTVPACSHDVVFRDLELTNSSPSGRVSLPAGGCTDAPGCCYVDGVAPPLKPECSATPAAIARAQWQPLLVAGDRVKVINVTVHDGGTGITTDQKALDTEIYGALVFNNGWVDPVTGQGRGLQIENLSPSWRPSRKSVKNSIIWNNFGDGYSSLTSWGHFSSNLQLEEIIAFNNGAPSAAFYAGDPVLYDQVQNHRYGNIMIQAEEMMHFIELERCRLYHPAESVVRRQQFGGIKDANYEFHKDLIISDSYLVSTGTPLSLIRWQRVRTTGSTVVGGATAAVGDTEALVEMEKTECSSLWATNAPWNALEMDYNAYYFTGAGTTPFGTKTSPSWSYKNFANWRTTIYNRDAHSSYSAGLPTANAVFVQPNAYEAGRAHVAIYNWLGASSVNVDLSSIGLNPGQGFRIFNVQAFDEGAVGDPFGTVVASGNYNPAQPLVSVPMSDTAVTGPVGLGATVPSTLPTFGAFLVRSTPCGDGAMDAGEACDDGNQVNGDGCDNNCTVSVCGNGAAGGAEECDDGNADESDACKSDCTFNVCGDGALESGVEVCDDGDLDDGDGCDSNCTVTACGNGVAAGAETCDDGNGTEGDGCDTNCTVSACGNAITAGGEVCDDGNLTSGDGCDSNCKPTACRNGVVTAGEGCDDGNGLDGDGCDNNCTVTACQNGIQTAGEACDDGNGISGDGCDGNCTVTACQNGVLTAGEVCDDGNGVSGDGCDSNCTPTGCRNGVQTSGEACDDGNSINGDGCDSNCTATACRNGVRSGVEQCDDGNAVDGDGCQSDCTYSPVSGDVSPGGKVSTDPLNQGATEERPVQIGIVTPTGGEITIAPAPAPSEEDGFSVVGVEFVIEAPPASPAIPLTLEFEVDASLIPPGVDPQRLDMMRGGLAVEECTGAMGTASPDPCLKSREVLLGGDVRLTVLSSHASLWSVIVRALAANEQGCVNAMNAAGMKVAKAQAKTAADCLKAAGKGLEANAQACLSADSSGKLAAIQAKTSATAADKCAVAPPFGFTGASNVNSTAVQEQRSLVADLFGANLTAGVILASTDELGAGCQRAVFNSTRKLFDGEAKMFLKCKKAGLAGKSELMVSATDLAGCFSQLKADAAGKIAKMVTKLTATLEKSCGGVNLADALPGSCAGRVGDAASCIQEQVACRVCRSFDLMDGIGTDCDLFDDGEDNASCS